MNPHVETVRALAEELADEYDFADYAMDSDLDELGFTKVEDRSVIDQRRWTNRYRSVFYRDGVYVSVTWNEGATELQDDGIDPQVRVREAVAVPSVKYEEIES